MVLKLYHYLKQTNMEKNAMLDKVPEVAKRTEQENEAMKKAANIAAGKNSIQSCVNTQSNVK